MSFAVLNRLLSRVGRPRLAEPSTDGRLVYAVGDIHGRLDLLTILMSKISADATRTATADQAVLVFLGDYVDRGPASRGVIEMVRAMQRASDFEVRALMGNHEQTLLRFLEDATIGPTWAEFGGSATLAAYGVAPPQQRSDTAGWAAAQAAFTAALPPDDLSFLRGLKLSDIYGDYMFVHAGVRPDTPLDRQEAADMLWIRDEFLDNERRLEKVVVHGHTPEVEPHLGQVRIGVDTGAYATGVLSAARLYGRSQSIIQARPVD